MECKILKHVSPWFNGVNSSIFEGNILVADDSEDSDCDWPEDRTKWLPVRKHDPVTIHEHLQLTLEEVKLGLCTQEIQDRSIFVPEI